MNTFETAYNNSHKTNALKDWWKKNSFLVFRIILFPLWIATIVIDKIKNIEAKKNVWSEERAEKFCNKYLPQICDKTETGFWFFNNGYGFTGYKCVRRHKKDRNFADCYQYKLFDYIRKQYEIDGYEKEVLSNDWDRIEVEFIKKEG